MPAFCKVNSVVRMRALTANGHDNITWYNYLDENMKPVDNIIQGMKRRFEDYEAAKVTQVLQFYDNKTNEMLSEFR